MHVPHKRVHGSGTGVRPRGKEPVPGVGGADKVERKEIVSFVQSSWCGSKRPVMRTLLSVESTKIVPVVRLASCRR